ncbi:MAG: DUF559 domain-containing protein, partial [Cyanobacteria bacterium J06648_10]
MKKESYSRIRGTVEQTEQSAKDMRKNPTLAEACLWQALRRRQLAGLK